MKWANGLIWACCALYVGVVITPTGVYEAIWKLATGKDAAAWVQAIGSIAAIVGAALIAAHQSREALTREKRAAAAALERAREALQARRSGLIGLCGMLVTMTSNASARLHHGGSEQIRSSPGNPFNILNALEQSVSSFAFDSLESSEGAAIFLRIRTLIPEIMILLGDIFNSAKEHEEQKFTDQRAQFTRHATMLEKEYQSLRLALGFPPVKL